MTGSITEEFVPGEILVKYKSTVSQAAADRISGAFSRSLNLGVRRRVDRGSPSGNVHLLRSGDGRDIRQLLPEIQRNPDVEIAQPNYIYRAQTLDPQYAQQWALKNTGQVVTGASYSTLPGIPGKDIDAESAWNLQPDCSSVVVAVIDSGVNYNQQDLLNVMATGMPTGNYACEVGTGTYGCDFVDAGDNDPMDVYGHGTHVAGIIGAQGNNNLGVTGVCQGSKILAVRVLNAAGSGTTSDIIQAVNFAAATGPGKGNAKVINMSLGGGSYDFLFYDAIETARNNGVVVVVAAGNSGSDHTYFPSLPCDYFNDNIICVAAMDQSYGIASFSDYDSHPDVATRKVDVGAPGTDILSPVAGTETAFVDSQVTGFPGWIYSGGWGFENCDFGGGSFVKLIQNPSVFPNTWCNWGTAGNNIANAMAYGTYNLAGVFDSVFIVFDASIDLTNAGDTFRVYGNPAGGDPSTGTLLDTFGGPFYTSGYLYSFGYDISGTNTVNYSLGFQYSTDSVNNYTYDSVAVAHLSILGFNLNSTLYQVYSGTSMASPVAAGIVALLFAHNPDYDYRDVVEAVIYSGDIESSLVGITKSGRVVDAYKALLYVPAPRNVTLTAQ